MALPTSYRAMAENSYAGSSAEFDALLQEFLIQGFEDLVPQIFPIIDWLKSEGRVKKIKPEGKYITFDVQTRLGNGAGFRGEGDYLPTPHPAQHVNGKVPWLRGIKGRIALTAEEFDVKNGAHSFANALTVETESLMREMQYLGQAALWGNGDGILAKVSGTISNTKTITLQSLENSSYCYPGSRWLYEGMSIIGVGASNAHDDNFDTATRISEIVSDTSIKVEDTIAASSPTASGLFLVEHQGANVDGVAAQALKGSVSIDVASSFRGPLGINAAVDDGTFYGSYAGISETTYPQWKSLVSSNGTTLRVLTMDLFNKMHAKMTRFMPEDAPVVGWTNRDVYREVTDALEHYVEFAPRQFKPGSNHWDLMIDGNTFGIRLDNACPSYFYWLNPSAFVLAQKSGPTLADNHGSMWRFQQDLDIYEAVWRWIFQLFTVNRRKHAVIRDISRTIASI